MWSGRARVYCAGFLRIAVLTMLTLATGMCINPSVGAEERSDRVDRAMDLGKVPE